MARELLPAGTAAPARSRTGAALAAGLFFLTCLGASQAVRAVALGAACAGCAAAGVLVLRRRQRLSPPLTALGLTAALDLLSVLWAPAGKFALNELLKLVTALGAALVLLALAPGDRRRAGRTLAAALSGMGALASLISLDTLSTRVLSGLYFCWAGLVHIPTGDFQAVSAGPRMTSIFLNPNVFSACAAVAALLGLGLLLSAGSRRARLVHGLCVGVNAAAFLLAGSRGAAAAMVPCLPLLLLLERPGRRGRLAVTGLAALLLSACAAALAAARGALEAWDGPDPVPLAAALLAGAALAPLSQRLDALAARLPRALRPRSVLLASGAVCAALGCFLWAALTWNSAPLSVSQQGVRRAFYPQSGTYTVTLETRGEMHLLLLSQTRQQAAQGVYTTLYSGQTGPGEDTLALSVTVPEGTAAVYLQADSPQGEAAIYSAAYRSGGNSGSIPLGYPLLPAFAAARLQGALQSHSLLLRLTYVQDGLKLAARSPLTGVGIGGVESALPRVQSWGYEVKYLHNHYVQTLAETGAAGLLCLLGLLVCCFRCVGQARREGESMAAPLGAALAFTALHAGVEVDLSYYAFLPMAFTLFALTGLYGRTPEPPARGLTAGGVLAGGVCLVFALLAGLNLYARSLAAAPGAGPEQLARAAALDPFESADYKLSCLIAAGLSPQDEQLAALAERYAGELAGLESNTVPPHLIRYYFRTGQQDAALETAADYAGRLPGFQAVWDTLFDLLLEFENDSPGFRAGVARLEELRLAWNRSHPTEITLEAEAAALAGRCAGP